MASGSGCSHPTKELGLLDTVSLALDAVDHATTSSKNVNIVEVERSGDVNLKAKIEHSKTHWSVLAEFGGEKVELVQPRRKWEKFLLCCSNVDDEEVAEVSNVKEFLALQSHPIWGDFFVTFYGKGDYGELVIGKKFAEGAQAELYDCTLKYCEDVRWYPEGHDRDLKLVLKVFKKGTFLKQIKAQLPQGLLQSHVEDMKNVNSPAGPIVHPKFMCRVHRGTLLKDGRFAFLMQKEHFDLRHLIDQNMKLRSGNDCGPLLGEEVELVMFEVALGVEWLHRRNIVHRDLKASNVLVWKNESNWQKYSCSVADYECSVGVVGTGFFRAPEVLQALEERKLREWPWVFSKAADIYGYGMMCYEVLTGAFPFQGRPCIDYDHVLSGHRPLVPKHVEDWIHELLFSCWQLDPAARPCIGDILSLILAHSKVARRLEKELVEQYGEDYRLGLCAQ